MPRKILLRTLLASLGLAAAFGALAVLSGNFESFWRVVATALLTAGAALLMFGCSFLMDRPFTRAAGLIGAAFVVVEFLLIMALLWFNAGDGLALIAGFLAALVGPAMVCAVMMGARDTRWAGRVGAPLCAVVGVLLLVGVWAGDHAWSGSHWYDLAIAISTFAPLAVMSLVGLGTDARHWRWLGIAAAAVAAGGMFYGTVNDSGRGEAIFAIVVSVAVVVAHANIVVRVPLPPAHRWLTYGTIAAAVATAALLDVIVFIGSGPWDGEGRGFARGAGATGILAGCGTLALFLQAAMQRKGRRKTVTIDTVTQVSLTCPACERTQTVPVGDARCAGCNLLIHTRFEEPRCPRCDYSLFKLTADRCPECGAPVDHAARLKRRLP